MNAAKLNNHFDNCIDLLSQLVGVPAFSNEEEEAADIWQQWLLDNKAENVCRFHNNVYAFSKTIDPRKPILLLNSHLDTVRPVESYSRDPFKPEIIDDKLYGLGSNDAGGAGVTLAATFLDLYKKEYLPFNLLLAITASEERMGEYGMRAFLPHLRLQGLYPHMAVVGEPTSMQPAVGERGLVVIDAEVAGKSGHAARNEGINAIYRAMEDISNLRRFIFPHESPILGPVTINVTMIEAGTQHNVVPDKCRYVVDVRTTDAYSNQETVEMLQRAMKWSVLTPRSIRIQASALSPSNPMYRAALKTGLMPFVSPTTSDMALMHDIPSLKLGPGESSRSHSADEFIRLSEIKRALEIYNRFLHNFGQLIF